MGLETILPPLMGLWFASIEWRIRQVDLRLRKSANIDDVNTIIDLKQESIKVLQREIKEDMKDIRKKVDALLHLKYQNSPPFEGRR